MRYSEAIALNIGQTLEFMGTVEAIIMTKAPNGNDIPLFIGVKIQGIFPLMYVQVDTEEKEFKE